MAAPIVVARVATGLLGEDLGRWAVRLGLLALLAAAVPMALAMLAFAAPARAGQRALGRAGRRRSAARRSAHPGRPGRDPARPAGAHAAGGGRLELPPALDGAGRHRRHRKRLWRQHGHLLGRRHRLRAVPALDLGPAGHRQRRQPVRLPRRAAGHGPLPAASGAGQDLRGALWAYNHADWYVAEILQKADRYGGLGASGGGLVAGWSNAPALNQYDERNYAERRHVAAVGRRRLLSRRARLAARGVWRAAGRHRPGDRADRPEHRDLDQRWDCWTPPAGRWRKAIAASGFSPRNGQVHSIGELEAWLDQGPLALDGASWFGEGHWFVATGYDQNGIYIRDSSGWDTRYLTWSRLYGEVGFSGWVVGVAGIGHAAFMKATEGGAAAKKWGASFGGIQSRATACLPGQASGARRLGLALTGGHLRP